MATSSDSFSKKTYFLFIKLLVIYILVLFFYSALTYKPDRIHSSFLINYLFNRTACLFFEYMIPFDWTFIFLVYSLFFDNSNLYLGDGRKVLFHQLISPGLNVIIISVLIYFIAMEFLVPTFRYEIDRVTNHSELAKILLHSAEEFDNSRNYKKALEAYETYKSIIKTDSKINVKIRTLKLAVLSMSSDKNGDDYIVPDNINDYMKLADYYYEKGNYFAAWFYYDYIGETTSQNRIRALDQIENIKKILIYRNSLMLDGDKAAFIDKTTKRIKKLYSALLSASSYISKENYIDAYYKYREILKDFPSIRDAENGADKSLIYLKQKIVDVEKAYDSSFFPGKNNFIFFYNNNTIIKCDCLIKSVDMSIMKEEYFFYGINIITLDDNAYGSAVYSKYAQLKNGYLSLVAFSKDKSYEIYYPVYKSVTKSGYDAAISALDDQYKSVFSSYYTFKDDKYYLNSIDDSTLVKLGEIYRENGIKFDLIENGELPFKYDMNTLYNLSYDYSSASNFSILKLMNLNNFYNNKKGSNPGFSSNFIAAVVAKRLSMVFVFLSSSILLCSFCFRYRVKEYRAYYLIIIPFVIALFLTIYSSVYHFNSVVFNVFSSVFDVNLLVFISILINLVVLFIILLYDSGTRVE